MNKRTVKVISMILSVAFIINVVLFPVNTALAARSESPQPSDVSIEGRTEPLDVAPEEKGFDATVDDQFMTDEELLSLVSFPVDEEQYVIKEDNGDGTKTATIYTKPIRFKDENGKWIDIDNTLIKSDSKSNPDHKYKNKNSEVEVLISEDLNTSNAIQMSYQDYSIAFKPLDILIKDNKSSANIGFVQTDSKDVKDNVLDTSKKYNSIVYTKVFNDKIDLKITPRANGVKEDIVLNEMPKETEFCFEISVKNTVPKLRKDGNVYFVDEENNILVGQIPAPYMYDSSPEESFSYDIKVEIEEISKGKYLYRMIPERSYLEDANRVYPVIIDPSYSYTRSDMSDTFITSKYYNNNYTADSHLKIGNSSDLGVSRGLIKLFNLIDVVGDNSKILGATFKFYQEYAGSSSPTIGLYDSDYFDNNLVTWATKPAIALSPAATLTVQSTGWKIWDITDLVDEWNNSGHGPTWDFCLCLKNVDEGPNMYKRFRSENYDDYYYPRFIVTYAEAPTAPTSVTVSPTTWTNDTIRVTWAGITQSSNATLTSVQYSTTSATSGFATISSPSGLSSGYKDLALPNGTRYVWIRGVNSQGLYETATRSVTVYKRDTVAPGAPTSVTTNPVATSTWTNDSAVFLSWSGITDATSGVKQAQYKIDSGSWVNIPTSYGVASGSVPITISSSGTHTISVRGVDNANNYGATRSETYKLDVDLPTSPTSVTLTPVSWESGTVTIVASGATDALSGFQKYQYSTTSATSGFADVPENNQITLTSGDTTVYVRAMDNAGNAGIAVSANVMPASVTNFSVQSNVNYTVALNWTASVTPDVTYDIYRNESGQTPELIAAGIDTDYWNDYNINYDNTYFYSVVTVKEYLSAEVKSVSTAGPQATIVSLDEVNKKVGKKDYEMFAEFSTQSGNGYINPASGNLMYETEDVIVESPIGALEFVRSYNSLTNYSTPLGQGWDHNYNIILLKEFDTNQNEIGTILKLGNGNMYRFAYDSQTGTYTRPAALYVELVFDSGTGKYTLTFKNKTEYLFNLSNQIERITDRNSNWVQFSYNDEGGLVFAEDNVGNEITITYSTETGEGGLIKTVTGSDRTYTYLYNGGRLAQAYVTYESQQIGEMYTYTNGMLTNITNPGGHDYDITYTSNRVATVTNPLSQVMMLTYSTDNSDLLVTTEFNHVSQQYWYDSTTLKLKKTKFESESPTLLTYDSDFNLTNITYPDSTEESFTYSSNGNGLTYVNKAGKTTTYAYGDTNNPDLLTQVEEPFNGTNTKVTVYEYDTAGNLTSTSVTGINQETEYTYNGYGEVLTQIITVTDGSNTYESETDYAYDSMGRLTSTTIITDDPNDNDIVTSQTYDSYGNVETETDAKGIVTKNYYNILGQQTQQTSAFGTAEAVSTYYEYDALGNVVSETDGESNETIYSYDDIGRQTRVDFADATYATTSYTVNADGTQVTTSYDAEGNKKIIVADKKGHTIVTGTAGDVTYSNNDTTTGNEYSYGSDVLIEYIRNTYDVMGNVTWTKDNTGVETTNTFNNMGWVTELTTTNDSLSATTTYTHDDMGNVLTETTPEINTVTTYDKLGRPLTIVKTKNGSSKTTTYEYNGVYSGKLRSVMTDPLNRDKIFEFDEKGNLVKEIFEDKTTVYTYDDNGNMLTSTLTDSNFSGQSAVTTYTYDSQNRKTSVTYSEDDQYVLYTYDDNGNVLTEVLYENDTLSCTIAYTYDDMNCVTETKKDNVTIAQYTYTDNGLLASVKYGSGTEDRKIGYLYDESGKIRQVRDLTNGGDLLIREYFYLDGQLDYLVDERGADDAKQDFTYDKLGRLTHVKYYDIDDVTVLEEYTLTYNDTINDAKSQIETETTTTNYGGVEIITEKEYIYDNLGRLSQESVTETVDGGTPTTTVTSYAYDAVGNQTSMTSGGNTLYYHYNDYDQLICTDTDNDLQTTSDIVTEYEYDLSGNQISMTEGDTVTTYLYDDANWLQSVTEKIGQNPVVTLATFEYDANGQRTQKTAGSNITNYFYNGIDLLYTKDDNGDIIEENVLEDDGSMINSRRADTYDYWYRQDIRGSVTNIVDMDDDVVKSYTYDAYGNTASTGSFINSFAYTGAVIDTETGLYYMNARYYDSMTGRFISEDSYRGDGEAFWHLYTYCNGDPINNTDPTGHLCLTIAGVTISVGALIAIVAVVYLTIDYAVRGKRSVLGVVSARVSSLVRSIARSISRAKTRARRYKRRNTYEKHHIVARRSSYARTGRKYLRRVGIGINSWINTVRIKYQLHRNLHNRTYYNGVNRAVRGAYRLSRNKNVRRIAVGATLLAIKGLLKIASRVC